MPSTHTFTATTKQRLDVFLAQAVGEAVISRAHVQRIIREHGVTLNGLIQPNPARKLKDGDIITITVPDPTSVDVIGEDILLDILFEDDHLLVINKPPGLAVHPSKGHDTGTLVHALLHHCGASLSGINGEARPGIVHRLDMDTSGVMVAAKHDRAHRGLAKQFAAHSIHRQYVALVRGRPMPTQGTVRGNIGRHPTQRLRRAVVNEGGKAATTYYTTLQAVGSALTLLACRLETGRTHQIRVHMAHIGHPILGDKLYGPKSGKDSLPTPARQMLHAAELGFVHPMTDAAMHWQTPLPPDMAEVIAAAE